MASRPKAAIIAEGATEQAILEVLINHHALIYSRADLLQEEIIRCRSGKRFAKQYLDKSFHSQIKIVRILDSRTEDFKLPLAYQKKISGVMNVYTRPEIEILYIIFHHDYQHYKNRSKDKPSIYAKKHYHDLNHLKSHDENLTFWDSHYDDLLNCLTLYKKYTNSSERCIADLLI